MYLMRSVSWLNICLYKYVNVEAWSIALTVAPFFKFLIKTKDIDF